MLHAFLVFALCPAVIAFHHSPAIRNRIYRGGVSSLSAGIDVSGLKFVPIPEEFNFDVVSTTAASTGTWTDLSNALIVAGGLAYFAYERRPRGSARDDLIEIRKSKLSGGSLGVFSKKYIAEGTELGSFPGFLVATEDALAASKKTNLMC